VRDGKSTHAMNAFRRIRQGLGRSIRKHRDLRDERYSHAQWFLLVGRAGLDVRKTPHPAALTPIFPPEDRFWADPFAWSAAGRRFIFCEEYFFATGLGRISVLELGGDLQPLGLSVPVIDEPRHLSYPFLFEHEQVLYMVPETAGSRRVDLYRCTRFPFEWTWERTLMDGIQAADSTLFEHDGRWWLFCAARIGKVRLNESLFAFHSDSPLSQHWFPHERNPLIRDYSTGRPGGRIFQDETGRLLRPAQDSVPRYGYGLSLNTIDTLTSHHYAEHRIWHASGESCGGWRAMHHLDWHDGLMVMDAQRLIPISERESC
jgi:hypothetical protein